MAKKEKIMVSLTSVILLFLIFILIIAMIGMYIYYNYMVKVKDDIHDKQDDILNSIQVNTEDTVINNKVKKTETEVSSINKEIYTYDEVKDILNKMQGLEELSVTDIEKQNDEYIVTADYYVPQTITEDEYNQMKAKQKITIDGKEYIYKNDDESEIIYNSGYGYITKTDNPREIDSFAITKYNNEYAFYREIGGVSVVINKVSKTIKVKLDKDTEVNEFPSGNEGLSLETAYADWPKEFINNNSIYLEIVDNKICIARDIR